MTALHPALLLALGSLLLAACHGPAPAPLATGEPPTLAPADAVDGRLVVFTAPRASPLAETFEAEHLPALRELADGSGVTVTVLDATRGAPPDVGLTPLLAFVNHRGRSIFQGRYADLPRVRNFLRTARRVPQREASFPLADVLVWREGRITLCGVVKVGDVTGTPPDGHDPAAFQREARAAVAEELRHFRQAEAVELGRSDRTFYLDLYPWCAEDGTLYVSTALYSQFHCKDPVFRTEPDAPFVGPWSERREVIARAARGLEAAVADTLANSRLGDGFDPLPDDTPLASWSWLGLDPPAPPRGTEPSAADIPEALPTRWTLDTSSPADSAEAALTFHFPAPMDSYAGEVADVSGQLTLGPRDDPAAGTGRVEIRATSVTMGDPGLDDWIHSAMVLDAETHPTAGFELESLERLHPPLSWGAITPALARGTFTMRGQEVPITMAIELEPVVIDAGPRLLATGSFEIPLVEVWGIDVPVGEPPTNQTLVFEVAFELVPAG